MTKPKQTPKASWKMSSAKPSTSTYTAFYLILLILTTINAVFSLTSFNKIGDSLRYIHDAPLLTCVTFGQYAAALLMAAGVVFLYKKRKEGLYLLFGAYTFTIITMIVLSFASDPIIAETVKQIAAQEGPKMSRQDAETFARIALNGIAVINILSSTLFALLWQLAWNKQTKKDSLAT
jgi:hypothetical protein